MTDVFERAQEHEQELRQDALTAQMRRAGLEGKTVDDSATHCAVCTDEIPQGRREAYPGVQLCVGCQAELEQGIAHAGTRPRRGHNRGVNHA